MLKKNIAAILNPYVPENEPEEIAPVIAPKPKFTVPENIYTPVTVDAPPSDVPPTEIVEDENSLRGNPAQNPVAAMPNDAPTAQPTNAANVAPAAVQPSALERARAARDAELDWAKNPVNEDKGWKGALLEGIQNFLHGMGEARRLNPRANAMEVLAGGGMGTGFGYVDRTWNDRRRHEQKLGEAQRDYQLQTQSAQTASALATAETNREDKKADNLRQANQFDAREKNRFMLETERFKNRMAQIDKQAQIEGNKWKKSVDENGRVWKQFNDGRTEPFMNPENPQEQDIDPNYKLYEVVSPMTGTPVKIKGAQLFSGESQMNAANTGIANQQIGDQNAYETRISKLNGDIATSSAKVAALEADYAKVQNAQYDDEIRKRDGLEKELRDERSKLAGLTKERDTMPKPEKRQTIQPGSLPKVSRDEFRKRLIKNGITDATMQQKLIDKAQTDGVFN